jgi:hypothetical protein
MDEVFPGSFILKHWKKFVYGFLAIAALTPFIFRLAHSRHKQSQIDFLNVKKYAASFYKGLPLDIDACHELEKIASKHDEVRPLADLILKNSFVEQGKTDQAIALATDCLKRGDPLIPSFYKDYSYATTLIFQQRYLEALDQAELLKIKLQQTNPGSFETLEAFNYLRILFLAKKIDDQKKYNLTLNQLKAHPGYKTIELIFSKGSYNLSQYLAHFTKIQNK